MLTPLTSVPLTLSGIKEINGGGGDDAITGNSAVNAIRGGTGVDTLSGGGSADTFLFSSGETGITLAAIDHIQDFLSGTNTLAFEGASGNNINFFDAGVVADFAVAKSAADLGMNGTVGYAFADNAKNDGWLFFDRDGNGSGDQAVELVGVMWLH